MPKRKKAVEAEPQEKQQYYSLSAILGYDAEYNLIFGERSNGKTYAALEYVLIKHVESGYVEQGAYIRRWKEDIIPARARNFFSGLEENGRVKEITGGKFTEVIHTSGALYLSNYDDILRKHILCKEPFMYCFCLSDVEHDKSTSYPDVTTIIFDEFITRRYYLPDEFSVFLNVLSTIIRNRMNVKIFMLGNTVNKFNPYFTEMGLRHCAEMKQGTIDLYKFGEKTGLKIAVEYCAATAAKKESNKYFCFDDSSAANMIINGAWELAIYPHLTMKFEKKDICFSYFIEFGDNILQADIVQTNDAFFTYVHEKTTPIRKPNEDLIYSLNYHEQGNYKRKLLSNESMVCARIAKFYAVGKVFYQNNEVGEIVRNYIRQSELTNLARL